MMSLNICSGWGRNGGIRVMGKLYGYPRLNTPPTVSNAPTPSYTIPVI